MLFFFPSLSCTLVFCPDVHQTHEMTWVLASCFLFCIYSPPFIADV
jgi:hypothetical protein